MVHQIRRLVLADLQHGSVREQRWRGRPEILVLRVHEGPVVWREVLRAGETRRQFQDRVAEVVGCRRRTVPRCGPDVAGPVDLGRGTSHPHRPVVADRHRLVVARRSATLRCRRDPAAVGRTVPVVAAVAENHVAIAQVQAGALQDRRGWLPGWIHGLVQHGRARVDVQSHEDVGRRAPAQLVGHGEDLAPGDVEYRRPGDADRRADVAARQVAGGDRRPDMAGPQDGAGVGGQGIHRVVLSRHVHPPGGLERLPVDLSVEHRRGPRRGGRGEGHARRVDSGPERAAVIDGPGRGGVDVRPGSRGAGGASRARRAQGSGSGDAREDQDESATDRGEQGTVGRRRATAARAAASGMREQRDAGNGNPFAQARR